jgi:CxxC-x17-CxxC domain-containing protein
MDNQRQMFQGNWTCNECGASITELPFEPRDTSTLKCRDCMRASRPARNDRPQRQMHSGDWTCAGCGGSITELPFQPRDTSNLKCRDCFRKEKNDR